MPRLPAGVAPSTTSGSAYGRWRQAQGVWHWGVDLAGRAGAPVVAPEAMTVVDVQAGDPDAEANTTLEASSPLTAIRNPWQGYGPGIVLGLGASGLYHLLAHVAHPTVGIGDTVDEGAPVGELASHVGASQPHVHWELRRHAIDTPDTRGADTVDPLAWVATGAAQPPPRGRPLPWWVWAGALWALSR